MSYYLIKYPFVAEDDGEISVLVGDIVTVLTTSSNDNQETSNNDGWVLVKHSNGSVGFIPRDYIDYQSKVNIADKSNLLQSVSSNKSVNLSNNNSKLNQSPPTNNNLSTSYSSNSVKSNNLSSSFYSKSNFNSTSTQQNEKLKIEDITVNSPIDKSNKRSNQLSKSVNQSIKPISTLSINQSIPMISPSSLPNIIPINNISNQSISLDDIDELIKKNDEWFNRIITNQNETFNVLTQMVDGLSKKLNDTSQISQELVSGMNQLESLIDEERKRIKQLNEAEKNKEMLERTQEITKTLDK